MSPKIDHVCNTVLHVVLFPIIAVCPLIVSSRLTWQTTSGKWETQARAVRVRRSITTTRGTGPGYTWSTRGHQRSWRSGTLSSSSTTGQVGCFCFSFTVQYYTVVTDFVWFYHQIQVAQMVERYASVGEGGVPGSNPGLVHWIFLFYYVKFKGSQNISTVHWDYMRCTTFSLNNFVFLRNCIDAGSWREKDRNKTGEM